MAEHGFLFKPEMVRALLDGRKTQTRRICTAHNSSIDGGPTGKALWARLDWSMSPAYPNLPAPYVDGHMAGQYWHVPMRPHPADRQDDPELWTVHRVYPRVQVGDVVWVRETWLAVGGTKAKSPRIVYKATWTEDEWMSPCWRSAMLMPRWAARILLRVTAIRAQRVQEISEDDAKAEGLRTNSLGQWLPGYPSAAGWMYPRDAFRSLWDSCSGHRPGCAWADNPPVWAYSFEKMEG